MDVKLIKPTTETIIPLINIIPFAMIYLLQTFEMTESFIICTLVIALAIIQTGVHKSIKLVDANEEKDPNNETLTMNDAMMFPLQIGSVLLVIYLLIKQFNPSMVNFVLRIQFSCTSIYAGTLALSLWIDSYMSNKTSEQFKVEVTNIYGNKITRLNVLSSLFVVILTGFWQSTNTIWSGNLLAQFLSVLVVTQISFDKFDIAFTIMWLLFVFDIVMVFQTELMVTVAKDLDLPLGIKAKNAEGKTRLMGLGDIIFPGLFIAMCYRFELVNNMKDKHASFTSWYLIVTLFGYIAGYLACFYINIRFNSPQPALLYLVPGVTLSFLFAVLVRGDYNKMINQNESNESAQVVKTEKNE